MGVNMNKRVIYFALIIILISGCASGFVPNVKIPGDPVDGINQIRADLPITGGARNQDLSVPTEPLPVVFLFLVDESGSIVGTDDAGKKCPTFSTNRPTHKENLATLFDILWSLPLEKLSHIHIGITRFGSRTEQIIKLGLFSEVDKAKVREYLDEMPSDNTTKYGEGLKNAAGQLNNYLKDKKVHKVLFILTDGFDITKEKEKKEAEKAFSDIDIGTQIYVNLACPDVAKQISRDDFDFWGAHRIPQANFSVPFFQTFFDIAHFPEWGKTWGLINRQNEYIDVPEIPGNTQYLQVFFEKFPDSKKDSINFILNGVIDTSKPIIGQIPTSEHNLELTIGTGLTPTDNCDAVKLKLIADNVIGFWRIESKPLKVLSPKIVPTQGETEFIVNFEPYFLTVELVPSPDSGLGFGRFADWARCYSDIGFEYSYDKKAFQNPGFLRHPVAKPVACYGQSGFLCYENDNRLLQTWEWTLNTDEDLSRDIVYVRPYVKFGENLLWGDEQLVNVFYRPMLVKNSIRVFSPNFSSVTDTAISFVEIETRYNLTVPTFKLARPANFQVPEKVSCPPYKSESNYQYLMIGASSKFRLNKKTIIEERKSQYDLAMDTYLFDNKGCGFSTLFIEWNRDNSKHELQSKWRCDYNSATNIWLCDDITLKDTIQ